MTDVAMWTCEIGSVPYYRVPEGGDQPLRKAVQECWETMFPGVEPIFISSGWGAPIPAKETKATCEANLGCASTEELINELVTRLMISGSGDSVSNMRNTEHVYRLGIILGSLSGVEREYRTVDDV